MPRYAAQIGSTLTGLRRTHAADLGNVGYDVLNDNESIESLVGCVWGPENVFRAGANRLDRMRQYDGIAVLTGRRVVLLKKKGMNKLITEMPLHNMESVDVDATGEVTLTGRSYSAWVGHGDPQAFTVSNQQKWDTVGAERSGAGWRSGELPEGPVVASSLFDRLSLHLLPAL